LFTVACRIYITKFFATVFAYDDHYDGDDDDDELCVQKERKTVVACMRMRMNVK